MGPAQFEASRMSNMSAYNNNGDLSNRNSGRGQPSYGPMGNISQPGTDQRKTSQKSNILQSHDFGPFSKRRNPDKKD